MTVYFVIVLTQSNMQKYVNRTFAMMSDVLVHQPTETHRNASTIAEYSPTAIEPENSGNKLK